MKLTGVRKYNDCPRTWMPAVFGMGGFGPAFDGTVAAVGLPHIEQSMRTDLAHAQFVLVGYQLCFALVLPWSMWAGVRFGFKNLWVASLAVYSALAIGCAMSPNLGFLIACRALQGLMAGLIVSCLPVLALSSTSVATLPGVAATISIPSAVGRVVGPGVGGLLLYATSWRIMFLVSVPICLFVAFVTRRAPRDHRPTEVTPPSFVSVFAVSLASGVLMASISAPSGSLGAEVRVLGVGASVGLLIVWLVRIRRIQSGVAEGLSGAFKKRVRNVLVVMFANGAVAAGAMLVLPYFIQVALGYNAAVCGLLLLSMGIGSVSGRAATALYRRLSLNYAAAASFAAAAIGIAVVAGFGHSSPGVLVAGLFVGGIGMGVVSNLLMVSLYVSVEERERVGVTVASRLAQQFGGVLGMVVVVQLLQFEKSVSVVGVTLEGSVLPLFLIAGAIVIMAVGCLHLLAGRNAV